MVALASFFFYRQIIRTGKITVKKVNTPLISAGTVFIPTSTSEQTLGNPGAALTIVEFMDFGCDRCVALHSIIKEFVRKHPREVRLVWKDGVKPGIFFDYALAHQAAYCAGKQNRFWEFTDAAITNKNNLSELGLKRIAVSDLNLDTEKWWLCANSPQTKQIIADSAKLAQQLGIKSLPAIFANNKLLNTSKDVNIQEMLENFIRK